MNVITTVFANFVYGEVHFARGAPQDPLGERPDPRPAAEGGLVLQQP